MLLTRDLEDRDSHQRRNAGGAQGVSQGGGVRSPGGPGWPGRRVWRSRDAHGEGCGVRGAGGGVTSLCGQDPLPPGPRRPAPSSLRSTQQTQPPMSPGWSGLAPGEGEGAAGTLPVGRASSGSGRGPSPLKWELSPGDGRGPSTHSLRPHTYLGGISGPGGTPWGPAWERNPHSRVCVCALKRCAHSATHLSHPGPRGQEMSPYPQP